MFHVQAWTTQVEEDLWRWSSARFGSQHGLVRSRRFLGFSVEDSRRVGDRQLPRASRAANE